MTNPKLLEIFEQVLKAYEEAEEMIIGERGGDWKALEKEIKEWREEFVAVLEEDELQQMADAASDEYHSGE